MLALCMPLLRLVGCVDSPEAKARRERRRNLIEGSIFSRKKGMLSRSQKYKLKLSEETGGLTLTPVDGGVLSSEEEFPLVDIGTCSPKSAGSTILVLKSPIGTVLVEVEAANQKQCDNIVLAIQVAFNHLPEVRCSCYSTCCHSNKQEMIDRANTHPSSSTLPMAFFFCRRQSRT